MTAFDSLSLLNGRFGGPAPMTPRGREQPLIFRGSVTAIDPDLPDEFIIINGGLLII